jgi:hypothetical protein
MTKDQIKSSAAAFITAAKLTEWNQEAHLALVAKVVKAELADAKGDADKVKLAILQCPLPALYANASAFRQWLQSKDVALIPATPASDKGVLNRFANLA